MFPLLAGQLWRPVAIALLIAGALGYRALLLHQRDAARAQATQLSASLADAEASNAALQSADRGAELRGSATAHADGSKRGGRSDAGTRCDGRDRKSTRLNSSHVAISYAVFC